VQPPPCRLRQPRRLALELRFDGERKGNIRSIADRLFDAGELWLQDADDRDGTLFTCTTVPATPGLLPNRERQYLWLITATAAAVGRSSSGAIVRPTIALTPRTR